MGRAWLVLRIDVRLRSPVLPGRWVVQIEVPDPVAARRRLLRVVAAREQALAVHRRHLCAARSHQARLEAAPPLGGGAASDRGPDGIRHGRQWTLTAATLAVRFGGAAEPPWDHRRRQQLAHPLAAPRRLVQRDVALVTKPADDRPRGAISEQLAQRAAPPRMCDVPHAAEVQHALPQGQPPHLDVLALVGRVELGIGHAAHVEMRRHLGEEGHAGVPVATRGHEHLGGRAARARQRGERLDQRRHRVVRVQDVGGEDEVVRRAEGCGERRRPPAELDDPRGRPTERVGAGVVLEQRQVAREVGQGHVGAEGVEHQRWQPASGAQLDGPPLGVARRVALHEARQHDRAVPDGRRKPFGPKLCLLQHQRRRWRLGGVGKAAERVQIWQLEACLAAHVLPLPGEGSETATAAAAAAGCQRNARPLTTHAGEGLVQRLRSGSLLCLVLAEQMAHSV